MVHDGLPQELTGLPYYYTASASSVHYLTSVTFGANEDVAFGSAFPFINTIIDRSTAIQPATIVVDGQYYRSFIPYESFGPERFVFDVSTNPYTTIDYMTFSPSIDVEANAGPLTINLPGASHPLTANIYGNTGQLAINIPIAFATFDTFNVYGNAGIATLDLYLTDGFFTGLSHMVNVFGNSGTLNIQSERLPYADIFDGRYLGQHRVGPGVCRACGASLELRVKTPG